MDNIHSKPENLKHTKQAENTEMHSVYSTSPALSMSINLRISMASTFHAASCDLASVTVYLLRKSRVQIVLSGVHTSSNCGEYWIVVGLLAPILQWSNSIRRAQHLVGRQLPFD